MCLPCLINRKSCYFDYRINKLFTQSCCLVRISYSAHMMLTYYMYMHKGSSYKLLNLKQYPQINKVRKTDCVGWIYSALCSATLYLSSLQTHLTNSWYATINHYCYMVLFWNKWLHPLEANFTYSQSMSSIALQISGSIPNSDEKRIVQVIHM